MSKKKKDRDEYDVGYGKPPQHTRFKPGQSGNPKGRPKQCQNLKSEIRNALVKKVTVTENGRVRSMSRLKAIVTGLTAKALKGDVRAAESVLRIANQYFPPNNDDQPPVVLQVMDIPTDETDDDGSEGQS
jgi:hypothetical protein